MPACLCHSDDIQLSLVVTAISLVYHSTCHCPKHTFLMGLEGLILHVIIVSIYGFSNHLSYQASYWPTEKQHGRTG